MKKELIALAIGTFMAGALITSCDSSSRKAEDARNAVIEANKDLEAANKKSLADMEVFRKETAARIATNEQKMTTLKANLANEKKETRAALKKKIEELEQKNRDLKKSLDEYQQEGKENWERFKTEFNHDMDEIGNALKDLTVRNTK